MALFSAFDDVVKERYLFTRANVIRLHNGSSFRCENESHIVGFSFSFSRAQYITLICMIISASFCAVINSSGKECVQKRLSVCRVCPGYQHEREH